jgi:hypothetical protein
MLKTDEEAATAESPAKGPVLARGSTGNCECGRGRPRDPRMLKTDEEAA